MLYMYTLLIILLLIFILAPLFGLILLIIRIILDLIQKSPFKLWLKHFILPTVLMSPVAVLILLLTDWDYIFHHVSGSKVYDAAYTEKYIEDFYGDDILLVSEKLESPISAKFVFISNKTGMEFTAFSEYNEYERILGPRNISSDYYEVLIKRLLDGDVIRIPLEEWIYFGGNNPYWLYITRNDAELCFGSNSKSLGIVKFENYLNDTRVDISYKDNKLCIEVPTIEGVEYFEFDMDL